MRCEGIATVTVSDINLNLKCVRLKDFVGSFLNLFSSRPDIPDVVMGPKVCDYYSVPAGMVQLIIILDPNTAKSQCTIKAYKAPRNLEPKKYLIKSFR